MIPMARYMSSPITQSDSFVSFLPPPPPKPAPENIRNLLPDYQVDHLLGSGGFADVYKGTDKNGKELALKIPKMDGDLADKNPEVIERFKSEAELWMRLEHRNIVKLYGVTIKPLPHMAMELMEGGSLKQLMKKHELTVGEAVQIMVQVLEGLSYAHKMASVHRDIKPENILFSTKGVAKITDWGIGKFMASESVTRSRDFKGTLSHSAPEQYNKREYGNVDWQTDIFQIGVMFYKMVTGKNPFKGEDIADCMGKVLMDQPELPSSLNSEVPEELDEVIMGSLKKRKEDRWGTDVMLYKLKEISEKKIIRVPDQRSDPEKKTLTDVPQVTQSIVQDSDHLTKPQELNPSVEESAAVTLSSQNQRQKIYSLALITFVLSIVGVIAVAVFVIFSNIPRPVSASGIVFFGIIFGIAGIFFSSISMLKIDKNPLQYKGRRMAIIGIIIGIILVIGGILGVIYIGIM